MKVCIVGAGAIGGYIGARLAVAGQAQVSAIARGATLQALRSHGWRVREAGALLQSPAHATDRPEDLGAQDLVVIAVKGPALAAAAAGLVPLIGPDTLVLPAMNGVPWWFIQGRAGLDDAPLASVDPGGRIAAAIPLAQVLGCVVHISTSTPEPGLVQHQMGRGLIIGEPGSGDTPRAQRIAALLAQAGFDAKVSPDVRKDIWYKLWGNLTMNPISAITGATVDRILADPLVRAFCSAAMQEAAAIGQHVGCPVAQAPEDRHKITAGLGPFKSSMLQDVEAQRPIELDGIVAATRELGQRAGLQTPNIDALLGLTRLFGRVHGLYPEASAA
ncbi:2-dehydropantoate 2-reductase [Xylophilus sp. GW821-FHT01B05]